MLSLQGAWVPPWLGKLCMPHGVAKNKKEGLQSKWVKTISSWPGLAFPALADSLYHYMSLLIFLPAILIPAYTSFSLAFLVMYSACKSNNKKGDNMPPWHTPFPIWNQSCFMSSFHWPQTSWNQKVDNVSLHPIRTMSTGWSHPSPCKTTVRLTTCKTTHYPLQGGSRSSGYWGPLWLAKQLQLLFSFSP